MTPAERGLDLLGRILGNRLAERIRINLPSRKPQLWERLPRALKGRAYLMREERVGARPQSRPLLVTLPDLDIRMECRPTDRITDLSIFLFGVYEIAGTRLLQNVLGPGATVVDVGANSGYYSLLAARLTGKQGQVYAFEPVAGPFERLQRNLHLNGIGNVKATRAAVGDVSGQYVIYPSALPNNDGLGSVVRGPQNSTVGEDVPMVTLDQVIGEIPGGRVDLVKVDVEGAEAQVFAGATALLGRADAPVLLFESFNVDPIEKLLAGFGYELRQLHYSLRNGLEFHQLGQPFDQTYAAYEAPNFVALKRHRRAKSFLEISADSRRRIPTLLRLLATLA